MKLLKRVVSGVSALTLGISSLFVFAPVVVQAAADTCTWTGGGTDANFLTTSNWSCDVDIIESGDALVFDATQADFDAKQPVNDMSGATFTSITFVEDETNDDSATISGNEFTLSGDIVSTDFGLTIENNITLNGTVSIGTVSLKGVIDGSGGFTTTNNATLCGANTFTGAVTVANGTTLNAFNASALGNTLGSTTVADGGDLQLHVANKGSSTEPLVLSGSGSSGYALRVSQADCSGGFGGGGPEEKLSEPDAYSATLSNVSLNSNTKIRIPYKATVTLAAATLNGNTITMTGTDSIFTSSFGTLVVNGTNSTYTPRKVTIKEGEATFFTNTMHPGESIAVNGEAGFVVLYTDSILTGSGVVGGVDAYPGSTINAGNSPGCLESGTVNMSEANLIVEIVGAEACTGYDQLKVTGDVHLFDPVIDLSFPSEDYLPVAGTKFVVISNDDTDAVNGTFANLPEGETFESNGGVFKISYVGGDGNDVEITVITAPTAPDTGFNLLTSNPALTLGIAVLAAGAIMFLGRRYARFNA